MRVFLMMSALVVLCAALACAAESTDSSATGTCPPATPAVCPSPTTTPAACPSPPSAPTVAAMTTTESVLDCALCCLNLSKDMLSTLRSKGWSDPDIAMAAIIAMRSGVAIDQIVTEYTSCTNWRDVAKQHNVSVADMIKLRTMAGTDMEAFNKALMSQCFSIAECDLTQMRTNGFSWSDICMIANASVRTGQTPMVIAELRKQGTSWNDIACKFGVSPDDITSPVMMRTVAMTTVTPAAGAGPTMPCYFKDYCGNIILDEDRAYRYYIRGYDWLDVAVAANIRRASGYPIDELLIQLNSGMTWREIAYKYGVCAAVAFNVCDWPFEKRTIYSQKANCSNMAKIAGYQTSAPTGAGPGCAGCPPSCYQGFTGGYGCPGCAPTMSWWLSKPVGFVYAP